MSLHADALSVLVNWRPVERSQESLRQAYLGFLLAREDACDRSCEPGHLTASAIVFDATATQVLLTLHPRVGKWLQLGGHCEPSDGHRGPAADDRGGYMAYGNRRVKHLRAHRSSGTFDDHVPLRRVDLQGPLRLRGMP
jgi:hypothetical protein